MKKFYSSIVFMLLALANVFGQFDATITITDELTALPLENVEVFLDGQAQNSNAAGQVTFTNLSDGTYQYSYTLACYELGSEMLTIAGSNVAESAVMTPSSTNNVFFFIGDPLTLPGATVSLFDSEGYFETITTGNFLGDIIYDVPFGEYSYTVEAECYQSISGSVTVDCAGGNGVIVAENPVEQSTNNVFFFIGDPLTLPGATVSLFDSEGYFETITTGNFLGDIIYDVPFGEYSYTVEAECYQSISGSVTVDCAGGNGVIVAENPVEQSTNNVFFFIGDPLTLPGATVSLFDSEGYFETITTGNFLGDIIYDVPFGEYNYTVEAECYQSISGSVTVDCAGGNGVIVAENPVEQSTNNVFFFIGDPLTLPGATVSLFDSEGFSETITTGNFLGDIIYDVPFGEYSYTVEAECYESISGTVTVDCAGGNGVIVAENPVEQSTNNVFFFIGDPLTLPGATVSLFDSEGFSETITTGNFLGDIIYDVPFGEYSYTVEAECYESISGTVTVDCAGGGGVSVAEIPVEQSTNSIFFFIGDPLTIPGATVTLFDTEGFSESITTGNFLGDIIYDVPFGEYSYTVEADCYESISGTVTVDCAGGGGVSVAEIPVEIELDNSVTVSGNTLSASSAGLSYQWIDCDNENSEIEGETGQSFTATVDGNYAVVISSENCSVTSECNSVVVTAINEASNSMNVSVYPVPAGSNLNIQLESAAGNSVVEILSYTGQLMIKENYSNSALMTLSISDLASGMYVLRVSNDLGQFTRPIIKQ